MQLKKYILRTAHVFHPAENLNTLATKRAGYYAVGHGKTAHVNRKRAFALVPYALLAHTGAGTGDDQGKIPGHIRAGRRIRHRIPGAEFLPTALCRKFHISRIHTNVQELP